MGFRSFDLFINLCLIFDPTLHALIFSDKIPESSKNNKRDQISNRLYVELYVESRPARHDIVGIVRKWKAGPVFYPILFK